MSGYATDDVEAISGNLNVIYQRLVDEVWRRGWGDGVGGHRHPGAGRFLDIDGFNGLMETIALAGWKGGDTRICTEQGFHAATKALKTAQAWEQFVKDSGADITNLAINFYLRRSDVDARGFEFTHKSFGDYLAALALIRVAFEVSELARIREEAGLKGWLDIVSDGRLSHEILDFIKRELLLLTSAVDLEKVHTLKRAFEGLASAVLRDGLPANGNAAETWRVAEERQRNAEIMIWAILAGCSAALAKLEPSSADALINVNWPDPGALGALLRRISSQADLATFSDSILPRKRLTDWPFELDWKTIATGAFVEFKNLDLIPKLGSNVNVDIKIGRNALIGEKVNWLTSIKDDASRILYVDLFTEISARQRVAAVTAPAMRCFAYLNAKRADLSCHIICGIDLRYADLREARLDNATILHSDMRGANLGKATFRNATVDTTLFREADLTESVWLQAKLLRTDLSQANLTNASLEGIVTLEGGVIDKRKKTGSPKKGPSAARTETAADDAHAEPSVANKGETA